MKPMIILITGYFSTSAKFCKIPWKYQQQKQWIQQLGSKFLGSRKTLGPTYGLWSKGLVWLHKGDVRRMTKSADFICWQNRLTKICRVSCKNRPILSADKIAPYISKKHVLVWTKKNTCEQKVKRIKAKRKHSVACCYFVTFLGFYNFIPPHQNIIFHHFL